MFQINGRFDDTSGLTERNRIKGV